MSKTDFCVFIGRFQPVHAAHLKIMEEALNEAKELVIVIGSYRAPRSLKNPWTYEERVDMIDRCLAPELRERVHYVHARDYLYNMLNWITGVQNAVAQVVKNGSVKMIGHFKDDSSFYLKLFPQWTLSQQPNFFGANSSDIRDELFDANGDMSRVANICSPYLADRLTAFRETEAYAHQFIKNYKKKWEDAPFPPTFVTTDAVVVQAGHVLLVKRGRNPGKGRYALPGGFISQTESILDSCLRELKEETEIVFPKSELKKYEKDSHVFAHPYRDVRGRTITHAHYFLIDHLGPLPAVKGGDDASEAIWVPLNDLALLEENFFSDHLHIVNYFIRRER